jgi:hypothetical protein
LTSVLASVLSSKLQQLFPSTSEREGNKNDFGLLMTGSKTGEKESASLRPG